MKIVKEKVQKKEINLDLAILAPDGQDSQIEDTNSATPEEIVEFYKNNNNPPTTLGGHFSLRIK